MSKPEESTKASTSTENGTKQWYKPSSDIKIGPQRRKRMPAGRHLDVVRTVPEQPKAPLRISDQLKAQLKDPEPAKTHPNVPEQPKAELQGEIQVK